MRFPHSTGFSAAAPSSAADLAEGQGVRAEGGFVMESYPGQTTARSVAVCSAPPESAAGRPPDTGVFFPEVSRPADSPLLIARGAFFLDEAGCLRVADVTNRGERGYVPLWPPAYELETPDEGVRVTDGKGRVVARVGERVFMGGGGIDRETLEEYGFLDERTMRELFERCPGDNYWMVLGGDVRLPSQGRA